MKVKGKDAKRFHENINNDKISKSQKRFLEEAKKEFEETLR